MAKPLIRIYADLTSQPARAIIAFSKFNKIPHELVMTRVIKRENTTQEYEKINPFRRVPSIMDLRPEAKGFTLYQSHAILRYLCRSFPVAKNWYPQDIKMKAMIDQYLESHHSGLRQGSKIIFLTRFLANMIGEEAAQKRAPPELISFLETQFHLSLNVMEEAWLGNSDRIAEAKKSGQGNFIAGVSSEPTIADLSAACELIQFKFIPEKFEEILSERPHIKAWLDKMMNYPEMKETHEFFEWAVKKFLERRAARAKL